MDRDDFPQPIKELLAKRVGVQCSNPNCRRPTSGPQTAQHKSINIGVAAHISAASKGGARFDQYLTKEQRQSMENGIWLCQDCAKLIDNDPNRYTADFLREWKRLSEAAALLAIEVPEGRRTKPTDDVEIIRFFAQCLDRPAFQDLFRQEGSMEAFDQAMEDTLTAINTGCLRSRDGAVLSQLWGKSFVTNPAWRRQMDTIADLIRAIRSRYIAAKQSGVIHVHNNGRGEESYCIHDSELSDWMDQTRSQILQMFTEICREAGVVPPTFPRPHRRW